MREVLGRVRDGELAEAVGRDVARALLLRLAVFEQRRPERVRDLGELGRRTVNDDLRGKFSQVGAQLESVVDAPP